MEIRNERGQTVVEYILLFAVVASLIATFYHSDVYRRLFGQNGEIGLRMKANNEFGYRHGYLNGNGTENYPVGSRNGALHPTYYDTENGGSRFFGPKEPYE